MKSVRVECPHCGHQMVWLWTAVRACAGCRAPYAVLWDADGLFVSGDKRDWFGRPSYSYTLRKDRMKTRLLRERRGNLPVPHSGPPAPAAGLPQPGDAPSRAR